MALLRRRGKASAVRARVSFSVEHRFPFRRSCLPSKQKGVLMRGEADKTVDALNGFLRGEISAVETYRQAIEKLGGSPTGAQLEDCRRSHEQRVAKLRDQVARLGGEPAEGLRRMGRVRAAGRGRVQGVRRTRRGGGARGGRRPRPEAVSRRPDQAGRAGAPARGDGPASRAGTDPPVHEHAEAHDALTDMRRTARRSRSGGRAGARRSFSEPRAGPLGLSRAAPWAWAR